VFGRPESHTQRQSGSEHNVERMRIFGQDRCALRPFVLQYPSEARDWRYGTKTGRMEEG
jgi:hypothetical protein